LQNSNGVNYLRVKDVSKIIDRDRDTILRWEREGKTPHVQKDNRGWRIYTEADLQVILDFMKTKAPYRAATKEE
jgi:DNA-binding transcriptional MerR regulator